MMRPKTRPLIIVSIIVAALGGIAVLVWSMSGLRPPREQDRVAPANGFFSIIKPRDWDTAVTYEPRYSPFVTTLEISHSHAIGRSDRLFVARTREKQDVAKLKSGGAVDGI